ncbi:MAG: helix-turn-helix transcriptional regulator [Leptospiraceae bacterium]|nr:helix-turn-helix transcriptional regulator [Leptospiraceae bacterium]MCP5511146.1 helix-turn-helix transcriptional regulator [Leptospiraceae bacterium]
MSTNDLIYLTHGFCGGCFLLSLFYLIFFLNPSRIRTHLVLLILASLSGIIIQSLALASPVMGAETFVLRMSKFILFLGQASVAFLFWILSFSLYQSEFSFRRKHFLVLLAQIFVPLLWGVFMYSGGSPEEVHFKWKQIAFLSYSISFNFVLLVHGLRNSYRERKVLHGRKKISEIHSFLGIVLIFNLIFKSMMEETSYRDLGNSFLSLVSTPAIIFILFRFMENRLEFNPRIQAPQILIQKDVLDWIEKMDELFYEKKIYREESLTIKTLAHRIDCKEYILRRIIKDELKFKNFNDLLNRFRIEEACLIISNSEETPKILKVSMNLGYSSSSAFDRAFKSLKGISPRDYQRLYGYQKSDLRDISLIGKSFGN